MHALIFADRIGQELEPLNERTCVALLPVVGKPVLEHTLEALVAAGVREAVIALLPTAIIPFNAIKTVANSIITFLLYKRVSKIFERNLIKQREPVHLQE